MNEYDKRIEIVKKTEDEVEDIINSLSKKEKNLAGIKDGEKYKNPEEYKRVIKRVIIRVNKKAVAFFDLNEYDNGYNAVVFTRNEDKYRNKGYASKAIKIALKWYDENKYKYKKPIIWWSEKRNIPSQKLAEKMGFKRDSSIEKSNDEWIRNNWIKYIYN